MKENDLALSIGIIDARHAIKPDSPPEEQFKQAARRALEFLDGFIRA